MIIKNTSSIIEAIINEEKRKIELFEIKIKHAPTIGKQYEGVTIKSLEKALPKELNLHITSGFIINSEGELSGQIDCMISKNTGILLPGTTNDYVYKIEDVLAVIEVKKNLFINDLIDAFFHLQEVKDLKKSSSDLPSGETRIIFETFSKATGRMIKSYSEVDKINDSNLEYIFHGLVAQFQHPLRIIIGYDGFKTEETLRNKFHDFLIDKNKGFGPFSYPDLIICGNSCLLKLNGEPYNPIMLNGYFEFFASCSNNNIQILTELLISRIDRFSPFDFIGDDNIEPIKPFICAKLNIEKEGWDFLVHGINEFEVNTIWKPFEISEEAFNLILELFKMPELKLSICSDLFQAVLKSNKLIIEELLNTNCIVRNDTDIFLIASILKCVKTKDSKFLIGEDKFGYFTNWLMKNEMI